MGNRFYILGQLSCISTTSNMLMANTLTEPFNKMQSLKATFTLGLVNFDQAFFVSFTVLFGHLITSWQ